MKNVRVMKMLSGLLALCLFMMIAPVSAFAAGGDTGGIGGGGGLEGSTKFKWNVAAGQKGYAWSKFIDSQVHPGYKTEALVTTLLKQKKVDVNICKNATAIWWISSAQGGEHWVQNFTGRTHGSNKSASVTGTLENPAVRYNRNATKIEQDNIKQWAGNKLDAKPGYTVLCSYRDPAPKKTTTTTYFNDVSYTYSSASKVDVDEYEYTDIHSYNASIEPMKIEGEYVGNGTWSNQPAVTVKTSFGTMFDNLATGSGSNVKSTNELRTLVANAINADKTKTFAPKVTLNSANRAFLAKGGIVNVSEHRIKATVRATTETTTLTNTTIRKVQPMKKVCTTISEFDPATGGYKSPVTTCVESNNGSATTSESSDPVVSKSHNVTKTLQAQENTGFWQMIAVHCNKPQFEALLSATGATALDSGDSTNKNSAVAKSKKYHSQPSVLDFGDPNNPEPNAAATSKMSFFDKECPFDCTASPNTSGGASTSNGATSNVNNSGFNNGALYGAYMVEGITRINNNFFELFRDNTANDLTVDVWYPKTEGVVNYKSNPKAPLTTTITRWNQGTPNVRGEGGKFTMKSGDTTLFTGSTQNIEQRNWHKAAFSNDKAHVLTGLHRKFTVQSSWASEKDRPQVLNFKWEYDPSVSTRFPSVLGFTRTGNTIASKSLATTPVTASTPIQGKCYANFGTNTSIDTTSVFHNNTGSGIPNNLDGVLLEGTGEKFTDISTNLVLNFVRAKAGTQGEQGWGAVNPPSEDAPPIDVPPNLAPGGPGSGIVFDPEPEPEPEPEPLVPEPDPEPVLPEPIPDPTPDPTPEPPDPLTPGRWFELFDRWGINTPYEQFNYGERADTILVGDWNGDGKDTFAIHRGITIYINNNIKGEGTVKEIIYGSPGDYILVGDWNGDGKDTFGIRRGKTFYLTNSTNGGASTIEYKFGRDDDIPIVGDWNGDGKDTIAVRRGTTMFINNSLAGGNADIKFDYGLETDEILAFDFNGNGSDSISFRRGNKIYIKNSLSGGSHIAYYTVGRSSDDIFFGSWKGTARDYPAIRRY